MPWAQLQWYWNKKNIKNFKGLGYAHSLSCLSCCAKWLICTMCMERQSNCCRMKAHVERCSGITVKSIKTPNTSPWSKRKHKELKSSSFLDAESLFNMENDNDGNAGKKQKIQCDLSLSHDISASFFENNSIHGDGGGTDQLVQNEMCGKNVDKAVFEMIWQK